MASEVSLEDLEKVFTGFGVTLDRIQQNQVKAIKNVLGDIVGQNDTRKEQSILTESIDNLTTYIIELSRKFNNNKTNEEPLPSNSKIPALDGARSTSLSQDTNKNTKALPVRILDALDLKGKKTEEIKTGKYNSVYIEIPEDTKILLENVLHDQFKYFFDDLFLKNGGIDDIYNTLHNIYEAIGSGKFGKEDKGNWLKDLLPFLPALVSPIAAALAAALGIALGASPLGKGISVLTRTLESIKARSGVKSINEEASKTTKQTETEEALNKVKEQELDFEQEKLKRERALDIKKAKTGEEIERLNEDLLSKRQKLAKIEQARSDVELENIDAENVRRKTLTDAEEASIKAKETKTNIDIQAAEDAKLIAEDARAKAIESNIKIQKTQADYDAVWKERYNIEEQIKNLETEQLKAIDAHNIEIENLKASKSTENIGKGTKAALSETTTKIAITDAAEVTEQVGLAGKALDGIKTALKPIGKVLKIAGRVGEGLAYLTNAYESYEDLKDEKELSTKQKFGTGAASALGVPVDIIAGAAELPFAAKSFFVDKKGFSESFEKNWFRENIANKSEILGHGKGAGAMIRENTKNLLKSANQTETPLKDLLVGLGLTKSESEKQADEAEMKLNEKKLQFNKIKDITPIQPTETPVIPQVQETDTSSEDISDMSDSLGEHTKLLKGMFEYQKQTAINSKSLLEAFNKGQFNNGNSVNIVNSSSTSVNSQQTKSSASRSAFSNRSYGQ